MFAIAGFLWYWGYNHERGIMAVIGAGVVGGILYDIVLNRGKYVLPKPEEDGINLGSLYGAIVGFAIAIAIIEALLPNHVPREKSLTAFLIALGVKAGGEVASTIRIQLMTRKSDIQYDVKNFKYGKDGDINVEGTLVLADLKKEETAKNKVIHINLKKEGEQRKEKETSRESLTTDDGKFQYTIKDIALGKWESWASWKGDEKFHGAESEHEFFEVKENNEGKKNH